MSLTWPDKDPDEVLDYSIDWTARLETDDTIVTSEWIVPEDDIVKDSDDLTDTSTTVWLSGGLVNQTYSFVNRVTTALGRTMDQTIKIRVKSR